MAWRIVLLGRFARAAGLAVSNGTVGRDFLGRTGLARLALPQNESPVNVGFGRGPEAGVLYVATVGVGKVYRLRVGKAGSVPGR